MVFTIKCIKLVISQRDTFEKTKGTFESREFEVEFEYWNLNIMRLGVGN